MKYKKSITTGILSLLSPVTNGQNLIAHWDFQPVPAPGFTLDAGVDFNGLGECATHQFSRVGLGHFSVVTPGSEGTSSAHCFGSWGSGNTEYISFKTTYTSDAIANVSMFNFDMRNLTATGHPTEFKVEWYQDGTLQGAYDSATDGVDPTITPSWQDFNIPINGLGSTAGASNMSEIRIIAYDIEGTPASFRGAGFDNIRIFGNYSCNIPEPSTTSCISLLGVVLLSRRRR